MIYYECWRVGDNSSKRKKILPIKLLIKIAEIGNEESASVGRQGMKIIIRSNIFDIGTKLEVLLRLELSGHTNTLTEASNLLYEIYTRGDIQNERQ